MNAVVVIGEMLVDRFESGPVAGGAPFNVARHLAAFGHAPLMLSAVGADADGELLLAEMARFGMARSGVQHHAAYASGLVEVVMGADGSHRFVIHDDCAWDHIELAPARAALGPEHGAAWLYAGTLALRGAVTRETQLALMQEHHGPCYLDLNWREGHVELDVAMHAIAFADVLKANDEELTMLCGWYGIAPPASDETDAMAAAASALFERLALERLFVTLGPQGAIAVDADGVTRCTAAPIGRLVDTVGAGDSFSAVVLAGSLRGWDVPTTLASATAFAARICEIQGAVPRDREAYSAWTAAS